ncbi:MAG: hypothetical protein KatS3mg057_1926 [Herpetosiphonaceae bacterium]|nr:MAG: hypothetical protein KatS3mg057_1926 [Herpetosiphonaceae bacterium]
MGDRLAALAWGDENDVAWIGLMEHGRRWSLESLGLDLYHGLPGIALFLAYLGSVTQEERYTRLARAALQKMRLQIAWGETGIASIGGFEGWGGVIYTLTHLAVLWNEPALLVEAEDVVERLAPLIEEDERLDIIAGAAGCIGSLISLYQCAPSERTLAAAVQCGWRLVARARPLDRGMGWATLGSSHALAGFAHGAAGIAWALLELSALSGEQDFRTGALAAIDYERSLFAPEYGNWLDLRERIAGSERQGDAPPAFMTAWCHGAPGIGLARLRSLPHLDDATVRAEIAAALRTTLARGCGYTHALCHGDLGNLEFLLQASRTIADPRLRTEVDRLAATILTNSVQTGWRCATPLEVETPGLMVGLAGIGYGLLRLAAPELVPSVLALEPPPLRDGAAWREALARLRQEQHRAATLIDRAISAAKRPMAYAIRIDLDDAVALQQAARPRREDDYAAERLLLHPYTPPIAVLRQLFYDRHIARVREAVAELGVPDAHLAIIRHPLPGDEWNDERVGMPMHFATAFRYETHIAGRRQSIRVAGPIFISMLHHVLAAHDIPVERKIQAAERVFAEYLKDIDDYDVTVIAIPKRKYQEHSFDVRPDTSLTHTVLLRACRSLVHYREQDGTGYYFLAHAADTGGMMREALFRDARAFDVCAAIRQIWSVKEVRETYEAHYQAQRALVEHLTMPVLSATVGAGAQ